MSTAALTQVRPVQGVPDGKDSPDPAVRQAWLDQRAGGLSATEVRDWGQASKRREIIDGKVTMHTEDLSHIPAVAHGNRREPVIATWIHGKFGIEPCSHVYSHGENVRHLASPDGISIDPFSKELIVGTQAARISEIKTSKHDLNPGRISNENILVEVDPSSQFARANYYTQMQWQMYVMNATWCLFVWEMHDGTIDPETKTFRPSGPPRWCWVPRDQGLIDVLVNTVAPKALREIDAARLTAGTGVIPPVSDIPAEHALLVSEYRAALEAETRAAKVKKEKWAALQAIYQSDDAPDVDKLDAGEAWLTVSTSTSLKPQTDEDAMRRRAPKLVAQYEALRERHTKPTPVTTRKMTITAKKG